jgi:uncharacterized membrane protein YcjF (UPF0283 family)
MEKKDLFAKLLTVGLLIIAGYLAASLYSKTLVMQYWTEYSYQFFGISTTAVIVMVIVELVATWWHNKNRK